MSLLVLQSSRWGRESRWLCLVCLPCVSWLFCGSSSWYHGVFCSLWLRHFLNILTYYFWAFWQPFPFDQKYAILYDVCYIKLQMYAKGLAQPRGVGVGRGWAPQKKFSILHNSEAPRGVCASLIPENNALISTNPSKKIPQLPESIFLCTPNP